MNDWKTTMTELRENVKNWQERNCNGETEEDNQFLYGEFTGLSYAELNGDFNKKMISLDLAPTPGWTEQENYLFYMNYYNLAAMIHEVLRLEYHTKFGIEPRFEYAMNETGISIDLTLS